ncbi:MAG: hypothetical protein RIT52_1762, partial [Pseudomonadota bacterium]
PRAALAMRNDPAASEQGIADRYFRETLTLQFPLHGRNEIGMCRRCQHKSHSSQQEKSSVQGARVCHGRRASS